jgi:hypothetical protein
MTPSYLSEDADLIRSELPEDVQPPADSDGLFTLYAVLMRAKGENVTPSDVHDAWAAWISCTGDQHKSLVPFESLNPETQQEDYPYVDAIHRAARRRAKMTREGHRVLQLLFSVCDHAPAQSTARPGSR